MVKKIIIPPYKEAIKEASKILKKGGIIIYPTDTLYGLGGDGTNSKTIKKIMKIKRRKKDAFSVIVAKSKIKKYCKIEKQYYKKLDKLLPGPYTFLLEAKKKIAATKNKTIGIRVPKNKFCLRLAEKFGKPIISTSANISGKSPKFRVEDIEKEIKDKVDLIIDGGPTKYKIGSTIVDLINKKIIRVGAGYKKIKEIFNDFHE
ncbi:MAG: L-threonylcarbamoyladenylate synthase [Candidatus Anstonellaceae archaeon]